MSAKNIIIETPWTFGKEKIDDKNVADFAKRVATRELREEESAKRQCLLQLKEWVENHQDIENCLTDDSFLLRFLRAKKFSIPMAQQMLLKYLNLRKKFKHIFYDMDCFDSKVNELISNGYIFASPYRDYNGSRVILTLPYKLNPNRHSSTDMARAHIITYESLLDEEENQILGFTHIGDGGNVTVGHVAIWSITEFATLMKWGEQSMPIRHKKFHILNMQPAFKYVVEFGASRVSEKLRNRIKFYNAPDELHQTVPRNVLPKEYGGSMPMSEMIDLWKKEMAVKRERLLSYDAMNLLSDRAIIRRRTADAVYDIESVQGSFRKLEVD